MMKALIVTNKVKRYVNGYKLMIEPLMELGYEVHWAADFSDYKEDLNHIPCKIHQVDFRSNPFKASNVKAYFQLSNVIDANNIDLIHCNTPIGGLLGRVCASRYRTKNIVYTAHGFHFYKGANPFLNIAFKWGEKILAKMTDVLITINKEDFLAAQKFKLRKKSDKIYFTHGVGINTGFIPNIDKSVLREKFNIPYNAILLFSAGEINKNKNNEVIIEAMSKLQNKNIYYVLCGEGELLERLKTKTKELHLKGNILFLGYRTDVLEILSIADIFVMPSYREGLPRSLMEAMDASKPCIVSDIRGNSDLIEYDAGGYLHNPRDVDGFAKSINILSKSKEKRRDFGEMNQRKVKDYDFSNVKKEMKKIYQEIKN